VVPQVGMVMAKTRQATCSEVPTALFFNTPTIAGLAAAISELEQAAAAAAAAAVPAAGYSDDALAAGVPCAPAQLRLLHWGSPRASSPAAHLAEALRLTGALEPTALEAALAVVAARHGALRTRFLERGQGTLVQAVLPPGCAEAAARLHRAALPPPKDLGAALQRRAAAPFNLLGASPPWRAVLYSGGGAGGCEHVLLLVVHCAVCDQWSLALLAAEVEAAYLAQRPGAGPLPPAPRLQLADVAAWQAAQLAAGAWREEQAFWRQQLAYAPLLLALPTDRPRPQALGVAARAVAASSPAGLGARLAELAAGCGASLFMVVLAAWKVLAPCLLPGLPYPTWAAVLASPQPPTCTWTVPLSDRFALHSPNAPCRLQQAGCGCHVRLPPAQHRPASCCPRRSTARADGHSFFCQGRCFHAALQWPRKQATMCHRACRCRCC